MVIIVNELGRLPLAAVHQADVVIARDGTVLKHRYVEPHLNPRRVKRALRLLGIKEDR